MDKFTASNGLTVGPHKEALLGHAIYSPSGLNTLDTAYSHLNSEEMQALREFFRAERDEELGRWRWPDNPSYVVYAKDGGDLVRVAQDADGGAFTVHRRDAGLEEATHPAWRAARAYFEAHPERKPHPWDNAERDEVWLFKSEGNGRALAWRAEDGWDVIDQRGNYHRGIQDVPAEMVEHSFWGWENATAERLTTAAEVHRAVD